MQETVMYILDTGSFLTLILKYQIKGLEGMDCKVSNFIHTIYGTKSKICTMRMKLVQL
jgi:hypothetical protein